MKNKFLLLLLLLLIVICFKAWFSNSLLSGGDLRYQSANTYENFSFIPYAWNTQRSEGLGGVYIPFLWNNIIAFIPTSILGGIFGMPWNWLEKVTFFYPFLILSFFSSLFLIKRVLPKSSFMLLSPVVFLFNTYILMLVSGGQMQIALAYALAPFIIGKIIDYAALIKEKKTQTIHPLLLLGLLISLQVAMDIRVVFVTVFAIGIYLLLSLEKGLLKKQLKMYSLLLGIPLLITLCLHAFWVLPAILYGQNPTEQLGVAYSSNEAVRFFSFAKLENTLALLHPNWPENLFGKTYFMREEFLFLTILAFASLLFISEKRKKEKNVIIYFSLIGLLGAFLAKGATEPLGDFYIWLFNHVPGFSLFRDPTKWYILIGIAYSVLIPFTVASSFKWLTSRKKLSRHVPKVFILLVISLFLFLLKPVVFGEVSGTLHRSVVPNDYLKLESLLVSQKDFSRTFWLPTADRFSFFSQNHPAIPGEGVFVVSSPSAVMDNLRKNKTFLEESSVKYVVVPYDTTNEIFVKDYKYDNKAFEQTIAQTATLSALKRVDGFDHMAVFQTPRHKDHFWFASSSAKITYAYKNPTEYIVTVKHAKKGDLLVFSEGFDSHWIAYNERTKEALFSKKYHIYYNSFLLSRDGNYTLKIYYKPQGWVTIGLGISIFSSILLAMLLLYKKKI